MDRRLTWIGPFEGSGAYPSINRHLSAAMARLGWTIFRNQHNDGLEVTPYAVSCVYPPTRVTLPHPTLNACLSTWEFGGKQGVPKSFLTAFADYELVVGMCPYAARLFAQALQADEKVRASFLGLDPQEFYPGLRPLDLRARFDLPDNAVVALWAGGTDRRHGMDIAVAAMEHVQSDRLYLVAKQSIHYPPDAVTHDRVRVLREDLPSMAPLYAGANVFLHTARATAPGLMVYEALACGRPVITTALHPVQDALLGEVFDPKHLRLVPGVWQSAGKHHVHPDCRPYWVEPDPVDFAAALDAFVAESCPRPTADEAASFGALWSWDDAAETLQMHLEEFTPSSIGE